MDVFVAGFLLVLFAIVIFVGLGWLVLLGLGWLLSKVAEAAVKAKEQSK